VASINIPDTNYFNACSLEDESALLHILVACKDGWLFQAVIALHYDNL